MEDIIDIIVTETTNLIEITSQPTDEIIDVNIIDNREDVTLNVTPTLVEININSLTGNFGILWGEIEGTLSNQTDLQNALNLKADLVDGKVPSSQLPSYVDDVVEVANYAALPVTGEVGKIYITLDTNYIYRWTGSTYVEIKDSSAVWGAITGTLSNQTDLQNALNAKAIDNAVVHLAGTETITGAKTFSSAVTAPNFILSGGTGNTGLYYGHTDRVVLANYTAGGIDFEVNGGSIVATLFPSGNYGLGITLDAGYKLDVNGTARISGALSGTSASFSSSITASSIIKSGGTSSQFLKADGSVDSNTYLTTSSAASTYISGSGVTDYYARFTGTKVIADGFIRTTSNITYVEGMGLSTGNGLDIQGNYGAGGGGLKIRSYDETTGNAYIDFANTGGRMYLGLNRSTTGGLMTNATSYATVLTTGLGTSNLEFGTNATKRMTIDGTTGAVTLTSALSGTSATFSGAINLTGTANSFQVASIFRNANRVFFGGDTGGYYFQNSGNTATVLQIADSGAATFSSSVTAAQLYTNSNAAASGFMQFNYATSNTSSRSWRLANDNVVYGDFAIQQSTTQTGTTFTNLLYINPSGNIGIGTTSPTEKLSLFGSTSTTFGLSLEPSGWNGAKHRFSVPVSGDTSMLSFNYNGSVVDSALYGTSAINVSSGVLTFLTGTTNTAPSERMRITSAGNVGIGTTSPVGDGTALNLYGATYATLKLQNSTTGTAITDGIDIVVAGSDLIIKNREAGNIAFYSNNTERIRLTSAGNLGVGTTTPISAAGYTGFTVYNATTGGIIQTTNGTVDSRMQISASAGYSGTFSSHDYILTTAATERMRITSGGDVCIGTTALSVGAKLQLKGNATSSAMSIDIGTNGYPAISFQNSSGAQQGYIVTNSSSVLYLSISDYRLKEDLKPINGLDIVNKIKVYDYKWKADNSRMDGVLAHELQEILPYAVYGNKDGEQMQSVDYSKIVPVLIQSIKELKSKIETLENK